MAYRQVLRFETQQIYAIPVSNASNLSYMNERTHFDSHLIVAVIDKWPYPASFQTICSFNLTTNKC